MIVRFNDEMIKPCHIDSKFKPICPIKEPVWRALYHGVVAQRRILDLFLGIRANSCDITVTVRVLDKYEYVLNAKKGEFTHAFYGKPIIMASLQNGDVKITGLVNDCYFIFGYTGDSMDLSGSSLVYTVPGKGQVTFVENTLRYMKIQYLTKEGAAWILQQRLYRRWLLWKKCRILHEALNEDTIRVVASWL